MRHAVIDVTSEMLPRLASVIADAGLRITGSLTCGFDGEEKIRLVVVDDFDRVLPDACAVRSDGGWQVVTFTFLQENYGSQVMTRIQSVDIVGQLIFGADGRSKVVKAAA